MNNKILTVSYGTFSCTLEGFEDNFGTMKAIAEYFRDLAADDRYFGAEPPQPDAEMLTRIAEREISRRVQAREHEGRIVLSASDPQPSDALAAAAPAAVVAAAQLAEVTAAPEEVAEEDLVAEDVAAAEAEDAPVAEPTESEAAAEVTDETHAEDTTEDVAAEDAAEDAPVEVIAEDVAVEEVVAEDEAIEDEDVIEASNEDTSADAEDETAEAEAEDEAVEAEAEAEVDVEEEDTPSEAEAFFAASQDDMDAMANHSEEDAIAEDAVAEDVAPTARVTPADSIAAKLQRIRAVVSQGQKDAAEDELFEDEHAEDMAPSVSATSITDDAEAEDASEDVVADAARDIEEAFKIDDEASAEDGAAEGEDDDVAAILARFDADAAAEAASQSEAESDDANASDVAEDDMGPDTLAEFMAADEGDAEMADTGENLFDDAEAEDDAEVEAEAAPEAPRRARVIKVKRADIDAALASGQLEEVDTDDQDDAGPTSLSDQEEAELLAELAQVEAEFPGEEDAQSEPVEMDGEAEQVADSDADDVMADSDEDDTDAAQDAEEVAAEAEEAPADEEEEIAAEAEAPAEATDEIEADDDTSEEAVEDVAAFEAQPKAQELKDDDVSRLMAEAENQMEEPEGSNRRDAFAHLKAAVKAKKADADIGNDSIKDEGAFRSDLAEVVKPRRPEVSGSRGDRPENARPAPLKLVAEQRVDVDSAPKGPVRPRRVETPQEATTQDTKGDESFADYVAELGAHDLPALLEAAASYLSFVEGRDQFSRPQLMKKVRQVEKEDFSREDGLRSFGQLLRAGKIEKISGGRFAVTGDIGYRPEQREAG
ncbi:hypothetical protein [uncultured Tateyamaria sp.]|uniref:hypothetical protein n=1 Tax=uncultured Tateyamaria sp. TaxID=455651 RepID=UPI0026312EE4|nr:hypothetical protein [uncultured Tateyamaria sp.]